MKKRHLIGLATAALILTAGVLTWDPLPAAPGAASLSAAAKNYDAEIIRDAYGVPHIYGARDVDTAFGLGFAHAEDDFETLQLTIAATRGHLARHKGKAAAPTDYLVNLMRVWQRIDARYAQEVPQDAKDMSRAFVAGLNLYAAQNPDKLWPGVFPVKEQDITAGFMFKSPLFYQFDKRLLELMAPDGGLALALDPGQSDAFIIGKEAQIARGSNGFAVSPQRSGDGVTRLFINSHQPIEGPVAWYEAHQISEEGLDIQGGLFSGTPIVLSGFNPHLGWANTVSIPDLFDAFKLTRNPDNKMQYRIDGEWLDFEVQIAPINVKLFGPFAYKARRKILRTVHGPVVETEHGDYAIKWAGMNESRLLSQYIRLAKTTNLDEFMGVMAMNALPSINYVYADKDGNIGLIHNGQYPSRAKGWNFQTILPGDRSDLNWRGYRPYSDVPKLINPESGFVWNANNDPTFATDGPDNLRRADFPAEMGLQDNQTNRSLRIMELTRDPSLPMTRERLLAIKFDNAYAAGSLADDFRNEVLAIDYSGEPELTAAQAHLRAWDLRTNKDSRTAALGVLVTLKTTSEIYTGDAPLPPDESLRFAVDYLMKHYGRIDPLYGELNILRRGDVSAPLSGSGDTLRAVYPSEYGDDGKLPMTAGDSYIALVEWDADGNQTASIAQPYGSNMQDAGSPHHNDQVELFANELFRPALLTKEAVIAQATARYRPGER